jgi:hypothetical protein
MYSPPLTGFFLNKKQPNGRQQWFSVFSFQFLEISDKLKTKN